MKTSVKSVKGGYSLAISDRKNPHQLIKAVFTTNRRSVNVVVSILPNNEKPELLVNIGDSLVGELVEWHFPISEKSADRLVRFPEELREDALAVTTIASWLGLFIAAIAPKIGCSHEN